MDLKAIVSKVAPMLGAALGGPFGASAGALIGKALGVPESEVASAITKDPDWALKLKAAENDFKLKMAEIGIKEEDLANQDRKDARSREVAVRDMTPKLLAGLVTAGFFGLLGLLCFKEVPGKSETIINIMVGSLGSAWMSIVSYYYGSSAGSKVKSDIIAKMSE